MADVASREHSTDNETFLTQLSSKFPPHTERLLDLVHVRHYNNIETLFRATSTAVAAGVVAATKNARRRFWKTWANWLHTKFIGIPTNLATLPRAQQTEVLAAYAHHVQSGGV